MSELAGQPVVAGIDGSPSGLDATRWAVREAERRGAGVRLVNVCTWPGQAATSDAPGISRYCTESLRLSRQRIAAAAMLAAQLAPAVPITQDVRTGSPAEVLVEESRTAQLMVVGHRGSGSFTDLLLGSVALEVAGHAACPVVVVRPGADDGGGRPVVVGVDGSAGGESALVFAFEEALARQVGLVAVHTWHDDIVEAELAPLLDWVAIELEEQDVLAERLAGWREKYPGVSVRQVVQRDRPAHALIAQAADAQLVVVGSRGQGGLAGLVLGSVSATVLHHAACPVAVVRSGSAESSR